MVLFSIRLAMRKSSFLAVLCQLAMSGGYLFGALGHHQYPSRAVDSPCG